MCKLNLWKNVPYLQEVLFYFKYSITKLKLQFVLEMTSVRSTFYLVSEEVKN